MSREILLVFISLCLFLLHPTPASAATEVLPGRSKHHPRACKQDDARCIALQRDVCDPWNVTASDKCTFVQVDEFCMEDVHRINYLALFYCHNKVAMVFGMGAWMLVLFLIMTVTAETFLCPAIEFLAEWMGLAPDIAGVTLFAFASGAPDLFTQVAALASGDHVDMELAVSATFGGGLFIVCVVFSAVVLASPDDTLQVPDRRAFIRDAFAYLISCVITICLLWVTSLGMIDGMLLVGGYFVYLALCLALRSSKAGVWVDADTHHRDHRYNPVPVLELGGNTNTQEENAMAIGGGVGGVGIGVSNNQEVELVPLTVSVVEDHSYVGPMLEPSMSSQPSAEVITGGRLGIAAGHHHQAHMPRPTSPLSGGAAAATFEKRRAPRHVDLSVNPTPNTAMRDAENPPGTSVLPHQPFLKAPVPPLPPPPTGASASASTASRGAILEDPRAADLADGTILSDLGSAFLRWVHQFSETLEDCLHLHGKRGLKRWFAVATAPIVLSMHLTMPAIGKGTFSVAYAAALSTIAPMFFLLTTSLDPGTLGMNTFMTFWISSSLVIFTLIFAIPSGGTNRAVPLGSASPDPTVTAPSFRPRRTVLLACLAFVQSIVWLNGTADEVVALFESIGRIWNIRRDVLGATALAWGETIPDLVAVLSLAKVGQGTMAVAACFGGPVFNLLVSMGGPILVATGKNGPVPYQLTSGVVVLVAATVGVLVFLMVAVPLMYGWKLPRKLGIGLLGFYAVSQVLFLLAEGQVV